ncbi:MAG: hypothetical protein DMF86_01715 [Acidobacteria bacterium]|nr:MAG: hypothetical protein DMF86_01715 [Acidobacteriota bacterium]
MLNFTPDDTRISDRPFTITLNGGADAEAAFAPEPFDSEVLGLRIGRIISLTAPSTTQYESVLKQVASRARRAGYDQILRRTLAQNLPEIWALERAGFELMDVGVTFARALRGALDAPSYDDLQVRQATDDDIREIACDMVREPWGSRYEADPAYGPAEVGDLRTRWLWNSHRGRADAVLVGVLDGRPAGYVTCRVDRQSGHGEIELVGTLPGFRGRNVASRVLTHAVAWFSTRTPLVTVRTQATNTAAASLYERGNFTLHSSDVTFRLAVGPSARVTA